MTGIKKMNDLSKTDLSEIHRCLKYMTKAGTTPYSSHTIALVKKIRAMIDIYCNQYPSHIELDRTPMQCDCYTRGQDDEFKMLVNAIHFILDGKDEGSGINYEPWTRLRKRLLKLVNK